MTWCSWWRDLVGDILGKMAKFITAIRLGTRAVVAKMTCLSTEKTHIITRHYTESGRGLCSSHLVCYAELLNKPDDLSQSLGVLLIYFGCDSGHIPKAFNKNADCYNVIIKSILLCCSFELMGVGS